MLKSIKLQLFFLFLLFSLPFSAIHAVILEPVGQWKTIDDKSKREKSIVEIWKQDGKLYGEVKQIFPENASADPNPRCLACKGERYNQPIIGMQVLWDLHFDGRRWSGGEILDPKTGKIYRVQMTMTSDGMQLKVRGFIGTALFGRTQIWHRVG